MKHVIIILILSMFACSIGMTQTSSLNLAVPAGTPNFQSDRVRAGELECDAAIGSATNVEFGVVGIINRGNPFDSTDTLSVSQKMNSNELVKDVGVYARITIPIGAPKQRLNCNLLYELELEKKRLEVFKLKQEIERLKNLQFEN